MWHSLGTTMASSFLASLVESVEALTVILAVGSTRGWRPTLIGGVAALVVLVVIVALFGGALARVPLNALQLVMGALLILFGLRWLQKAALRASGLIPLHDEAQIFRDEQRRLQTIGLRTGWDGVAFATAFQITILEGTEVVFVIIGLSAGSSRLLGRKYGSRGRFDPRGHSRRTYSPPLSERAGKPAEARCRRIAVCLRRFLVRRRARSFVAGR